MEKNFLDDIVVIDPRKMETIGTLRDVMKKGYWITEVFGSEAYFVKKRRFRNSFLCFIGHIKFNKHEDEALRFIIRFADKQFDKYKKILLGE